MIHMFAASGIPAESASKRLGINLCSFTLWTTYRTLIGSLPVIVFNALCFMLSAAILILKLRKSDAAGKALA